MAEKQQLIKIVQELQSGNKDMAAVLYEAYYRDLHYYILKRVNDPEKAEALTQDTFIDIFDMVGTLDSADNFVEWSRKVADWRCDAYKRMRKELLVGKVGTAVVDSVAGKEEKTTDIPAVGIKAVIKKIEPFVRKIIVGIVVTIILATVNNIDIDWKHKEETLGSEETMSVEVNEESSVALQNTESEMTEEMPEGTEAEGMESSEIQSQETESQETKSQETDPQETEPQRTESKETEIQETEPKETEFQENWSTEEATEDKGVEDESTESIETGSVETDSAETKTEGTEQEENRSTVSENLDYELRDSYYVVTGIGSCVDAYVVIPEVYNGLPVREIGDNAFNGFYDLTGITIPNSVTRIGANAFSGCFKLTSVTIPDSITCIEESTFSGCFGLQNVVIPDSVTRIEAYAFSSCPKITSFVIPEGVVSIGGCAFSGCDSLRNITIPDSVTSIEGHVFSGCTSLTEITIPSSVRKIGNNLIAICDNMGKITVAEGNPVYHSAGNCLIETASKTLIIGCKTSEIPSDGSVTSIGAEAFRNCVGLTEIFIPQNVTTIGEYAFDACENLRKVEMSDSVTCIGDFAFAYCNQLDSLMIPRNVSAIGKNIIQGCESLKKITVAEENSVYHSAGNCLIETADKSVIAGGLNCVIPTDGSVIKIGDHAFSKGKNLAGLILPDGITSIGEYAFYASAGWTDLVFPDSLTSIGDFAFLDCTSLTSITVPASVTNIGIWAFNRCLNLERITIEEGNPVYHSAENWLIETESKTLIIGSKNSVIPTDGTITIIGREAFANCRSQKNVTIPEGVTEIGWYSFSYCEVESITIPASLTVIGVGAFYDCHNLRDFYYAGTISEWNMLEKFIEWDLDIGNYTVHCTDGDIYR